MVLKSETLGQTEALLSFHCSEPHWAAVPQRFLETITEEDHTDSSVAPKGKAMLHGGNLQGNDNHCKLHKGCHMFAIFFRKLQRARWKLLEIEIAHLLLPRAKDVL